MNKELDLMQFAHQVERVLNIESINMTKICCKVLY